MQRGHKREREEGFSLDEFRQSFLQALKKSTLVDSTLYHYLVSLKLTNKTAADLITGLKQQPDITDVEIVLLAIALLFEGNMTEHDIAFIQLTAASAADVSKAEEDMLAAIKLDIVTAIKAQLKPLVFMADMIKCLLHQSALAGILALLTKVDSGYGEILANPDNFKQQSHATLFYLLFKTISEEYVGADQLRQQEMQQKEVGARLAHTETRKLLKKLGCSSRTINALLETYKHNLYQFNMLNGEFNQVLVRAVTNQTEKMKLINRLMAQGNEAKSKRQRFNMCPPENTGPVLKWLSEDMSELENLFFMLEGVTDDVLVLETIYENRELFNRGVDVADCCNVIPEHLCLQVLDDLLDEDCDDRYVVDALGGVKAELASAYLFGQSPVIAGQDSETYLEYIRLADEGTDIERVLLDNLECFTAEHINYVLDNVGGEFGVNYLISCLSLTSAFCLETYLSHSQSMFVGASENALRILFRMILEKLGKPAGIDMRMINTIAAVAARHDADADISDMEEFDEAINVYLSHLPDHLKIIVMYGMHLAYQAINDNSFIYSLSRSNQRLLLKSKFKAIASHFSLYDILSLTKDCIKESNVVANYCGRFDDADISAFAKLLRKKKLTKAEVRQCVLRCYYKYIETMGKFILCDQTNTFLTLLMKYAITEFRKIVAPEFKKMIYPKGFMSGVLQFSHDVRIEVMLSVANVCPANELAKLNNEAIFPGLDVNKKRSYLKRALSSTAKGYSAFSYMQAVFNADPDAYLEYCSEVSKLPHSLTTYTDVTNDNAMRIRIVCALAPHISIAMYRHLALKSLILGEAELASLLRSNLEPGVRKIVNSQLIDYRLTERMKRGEVIATEELVRTEADALQINRHNHEYDFVFYRICDEDGIIKFMKELLETERFEFVMSIDWLNQTLLRRQLEHRITKVQMILSLLPLPYQRSFAEKVVSTFNANDQIIQVASAIRNTNERETFLKNNKIQSQASIVKFGAFKPKQDSSAAEPEKKILKRGR